MCVCAHALQHYLKNILVFFPLERCARIHWHLPYRWQVYDLSISKWIDLQCMEDIERAYCDPQKDSNGSKAASSVAGLLGFLSIQR